MKEHANSLTHNQGVAGSCPAGSTKQKASATNLQMPFLCLYMYFVYILYSASRQKYYVGYTASLADRLAKHNAKHKGFTNVVNDWKIIYSEKFPSKIVAMAREKQIKGWKSRQLIDDLIKKRSNEHQR